MNDIFSILARMITGQDKTPITIRVKTGGGEARYPRMVLIHQCCLMEQGVGQELPRIRIVAQGEDGHGPFSFVFPPDGIDPDQPACRGMAIVDISS